MKRNQLNRYEQEAEEVFQNYYGDEDYYDEEDYDEEDYDDEDYYDEEDYDEEDYDDEEDFVGTPRTTQSIADKRHLTFRIKNTATDVNQVPIAKQVTLFGSFGNQNNDPKVFISLDEHDYNAFLAETAANPYTLVNPRYRVKDANQYANSWQMKEVQPSGEEKSYRIQPQNYEDPRNNNDKLILMEGVKMVADGRSSLTFQLEAGEEISIAFEIAARVNNSLLLQKKGAVQGQSPSKGNGCACSDRKGRKGRKGGNNRNRKGSGRRMNRRNDRY